MAASKNDCSIRVNTSRWVFLLVVKCVSPNFITEFINNLSYNILQVHWCSDTIKDTFVKFHWRWLVSLVKSWRASVNNNSLLIATQPCICVYTSFIKFLMKVDNSSLAANIKLTFFCLRRPTTTAIIFSWGDNILVLTLHTYTHIHTLTLSHHNTHI